MKRYRVTDELVDGTIEQDCGIYEYGALPVRLREAISADLDAEEWMLPALSDGEELPDLVTRVQVVGE